MRFLHSLLLLAAAGAAQAASSWGFDDASVVVGSKKSADRSVIKYVLFYFILLRTSQQLQALHTILRSGLKQQQQQQHALLTAFFHPQPCRFSETSPASEPVSFGSSEPLKVLLTAKENGKAKRPHQAFLVLREPASGLEAPFPFTVKDNGKAVVEIVRFTCSPGRRKNPPKTAYLSACTVYSNKRPPTHTHTYRNKPTSPSSSPSPRSPSRPPWCWPRSARRPPASKKPSSTSRWCAPPKTSSPSSTRSPCATASSRRSTTSSGPATRPRPRSCPWSSRSPSSSPCLVLLLAYVHPPFSLSPPLVFFFLPPVPVCSI